MITVYRLKIRPLHQIRYVNMLIFVCFKHNLTIKFDNMGLSTIILYHYQETVSVIQKHHDALTPLFHI